MKRIVLVSALVTINACLAIAADMPVVTKAPSQSLGSSGYFGLYGGYQHTKFSYNDATDDVGVGGGEARVNIWYTPNFSAQFDLQGEAAGSYSNCCVGDHKYRLEGMLGVHLAVRNPNSGAFGIFGAVSANRNLAEADTHPAPMSNWWLGLEGQMYMGNSTLYGQVGVADWIGGSINEGALQNIWFARGVYRYFLTPNSMVSAELAYLTGTDVTDRERRNYWSWAARYEQGIQGSLWSWYLEYAGMSGHNKPDSYKSDYHMFLIGMRTYFGQGTLLANDRSGATFDLPKFTRHLSHAYNDY